MRSSPVLWCVLASALGIAVGGEARADDRGAAVARVASHVGRIEGDRVTWQSSFVGNVASDPPSSSPRWERVELARPVVGELDAERSPGVAAVVDATKAIVAVDVDTRIVPGWREEVTFVLHAREDRSGEEATLAPPLAAGGCVQRVEVSGEKDLRFEPDTSLGFVHEVGSWSTPGVSERARHEADALLGGRDAPIDEAPIYVEATSPVLRDGLRGRALTAQERARPGMILAVVVFLLLAAGCVGAYRWLAGDARIEEAEAAIRQDFEREVTER